MAHSLLGSEGHPGPALSHDADAPSHHVDPPSVLTAVVARTTIKLLAETGMCSGRRGAANGRVGQVGGAGWGKSAWQDRKACQTEGMA